MSRSHRRTACLLGLLALGAALAPAPQDPPGPKLKEIQRRLRDAEQDLPVLRLKEMLDGPLPSPPEAVQSPKTLAKARYQAARKVFDLYVKLIEKPPAPTDDELKHFERIQRRQVDAFEQLTTWSRHMTDAQLDMADSRAERITALRQDLFRTRRIESICEELAKGAASGATQLDVARMHFYRLQAEDRLAKELNARPPAAPTSRR
jgi:hypothetical protein